MKYIWNIDKRTMQNSDGRELSHRISNQIDIWQDTSVTVVTRIINISKPIVCDVFISKEFLSGTNITCPICNNLLVYDSDSYGQTSGRYMCPSDGTILFVMVSNKK